MVNIISDELLKDLNEGRVIDIEIAGLGFSLASEKWVKIQEEKGNIRKKGIDMSCKGCIFDNVDSVNEPCFMCKRNPEDNRQDYYYHGGVVDYVENELGIKLSTHQKALLVKAAKRDQGDD